MKVKKKLKKKKKVREEFMYSPEFTARIVGAEPISVTQKQINKLIRQAQTGLEVRPAVRIVSKIKRQKGFRIQKFKPQKFNVAKHLKSIERSFRF